MANALNRTIKKGEEVVIRADVLCPEFQALDWRTVEVVDESFGNDPYTRGSALYVRYKDGEETRIDAVADIDVAATNALTAQTVAAAPRASCGIYRAALRVVRRLAATGAAARNLLLQFLRRNS
jgi:hypothetical protein